MSLLSQGTLRTTYGEEIHRCGETSGWGNRDGLVPLSLVNPPRSVCPISGSWHRRNCPDCFGETHQWTGKLCCTRHDVYAISSFFFLLPTRSHSSLLCCSVSLLCYKYHVVLLPRQPAVLFSFLIKLKVICTVISINMLSIQVNYYASKK